MPWVDVDNSGKIDATDTFYLMYYIALRAVGQEPPAEVVPEACDIDKNGTVTLPTCSILWCISHTAAQECR